MKKRLFNNIAQLSQYLRVVILVLLSASVVSSCKPAKSLVYFQNLQKDSVQRNIVSQTFDLRIRKNDQLSIVVSSVSLSLPENSGVYNTSGTQSGIMVDQEGNIRVPKIGVIHAEGLTRAELRDYVMKSLSPYLKDPVITVNFINQRITVLGEVQKPGVVPMSNEKMSLLEVLSVSGDITVYGKRDNILIIRENETSRDFKRISLEKDELFTSPYYYLQPNDVVYVEPTKAKYNERRQEIQQIISYVLSGITVLLLVLDRIIR